MKTALGCVLLAVAVVLDVLDSRKRAGHGTDLDPVGSERRPTS